MKVETFGIFLQLVKLTTSSILLGPKKCIVLRERRILTFFNYWTPFGPPLFWNQRLATISPINK